MPLLFILLALLCGNASAKSWSEPQYAGVFTDPDLDEVSGLAASHAHPGMYWAQNDSSNSESLIAIKADGSRLATLKIDGVRNIDWEDLDSFDLDGKHYLMLADTGDNGGIRKTLSLIVVEEPAGIRDGDTLRPAWTIEFRWPDGARDCEATAVDAAKGEILLISKKRVPPELFRLPLRPEPGLQTAQLIATLPGIDQPDQAELKKNPIWGRYRSQISGADLSPNGRVLAVLNYHSIYLYARQPGEDWPSAMQRAPGILPLPWLPQAEAIAFSLDGQTLMIGSEQRPSPLIRFQVRP